MTEFDVQYHRLVNIYKISNFHHCDITYANAFRGLYYAYRDGNFNLPVMNIYDLNIEKLWDLIKEFLECVSRQKYMPLFSYSLKSFQEWCQSFKDSDSYKEIDQFIMNFNNDKVINLSMNHFNERNNCMIIVEATMHDLLTLLKNLFILIKDELIKTLEKEVEIEEVINIIAKHVWTLEKYIFELNVLNEKSYIQPIEIDFGDVTPYQIMEDMEDTEDAEDDD